MALLDVPAGPVVGRALAFLLELRIEEGPLGEEEAEKRLRAWWSAQQAN
jgi:poly(A) polymerase